MKKALLFGVACFLMIAGTFVTCDYISNNASQESGIGSNDEDHGGPFRRWHHNRHQKRHQRHQKESETQIID